MMILGSFGAPKMKAIAAANTAITKAAHPRANAQLKENWDMMASEQTDAVYVVIPINKKIAKYVKES